MYTVKWIGPNGCEFLYGDARGISYTPGKVARTSDDLEETAKVSFYFKGEQSNDPGDCHVMINSGHVFVMNGDGKTVANYTLSSREFPHGLAPNREMAA